MATMSTRRGALDRARRAREVEAHRATTYRDGLALDRLAVEAVEVAREAAGMDAQTAGETWAMRQWMAATVPAPAADTETVRWQCGPDCQHVTHRPTSVGRGQWRLARTTGTEHVHAIVGRADVFNRHGSLQVKPDRVATLDMRPRHEAAGGSNGPALWAPVWPTEWYSGTEAGQRPSFRQSIRRALAAAGVTAEAFRRATEARQRRAAPAVEVEGAERQLVARGDRSGRVITPRQRPAAVEVEVEAAVEAATSTAEAVEAATEAAAAVWQAAAGRTLTKSQRRDVRRKARRHAAKAAAAVEAAAAE